MFYSYDILQKRGKFGIIWLAATSRRRITRRDISGVDVQRSSEDVMSILTNHETLEKQKARFSLYLSSQLFYGLVVVHSQKSAYLYDEIRCMLSTITSFQLPIESCIDLNIPTDKFKVTFEPPDMEDVSPDFGRLKPLPDPSEHLSYEYFLVTTPRSSEEWVVTPGSQERDRAAFDPELLDGVEDLNRSFRGDITMEEADNEEPIPFEVGGEDVDFLTGPLGFMDLPSDEQTERVVLPPADQPTPPQEEPLPPPVVSPSPPGSAVRPPRVRPTPPVGQGSSSSSSSPALPPPVGGPSHVQTDQGSDVSPHPATPHQRPPRRASPDDDTFVLDPVVDPTRRRRRRRRNLVVDRVIALTPQQIQNNIRTADERLTTPLIIPGLGEPASSLLQRLSTRNVASAIQNIMNRYRTLPQPDEIMYSDEEPEEEASEEPVAAVHVTEDESAVEARRAVDSLEGTLDPSTGRFLTSSSLRVPDASSRILHGTRDTTTSPIPRVSVDFNQELLLDQENILDQALLLDQEPVQDQEPMVEQEPISNVQQPDFEAEDLAQPMEEVFHPDVQMEGEPQQRPTVPGVCEWSPVSPVRSPPPSSYESLSPFLEEVMASVRCRADESPLALATFTALVSELRRPVRRKDVAKLFNGLLHLHTQRRIELIQHKPNSEIFIKIQPEEEEDQEMQI